MELVVSNWIILFTNKGHSIQLVYIYIYIYTCVCVILYILYTHIHTYRLLRKVFRVWWDKDLSGMPGPHGTNSALQG